MQGHASGYICTTDIACIRLICMREDYIMLGKVSTFYGAFVMLLESYKRKTFGSNNNF